MRQIAVQRFGKHDNAFGVLRLLLASLVIVSHTPAIVDGDGHREPLTQIFHSISFGELAVDGFFILSGFLITGSFLSSSSEISYLKKRIARIYPGFVVCSLVCVLIVGPLAGAYVAKGPVFATASVIGRMVLLLPPAMVNVFPGSFYPALNGSAWTIQYEFLCYLIVLLIGRMGRLQSWRFLASASAISLLIFSFAPSAVSQALNEIGSRNLFLLEDRMTLFRLAGMFFAGGTFYLLQDRIPLTKTLLLAALPCLAATLFIPAVATLGVAIFGSYMLFAAGALGSGTVLAKINNRNDISYGVYLYAWPIEKMLIWAGVWKNLLLLGFVTFILSAGAGTISWFLFEKPAMSLARTSGMRRLFAGIWEKPHSRSAMLDAKHRKAHPETDLRTSDGARQ